MLGTRASADPQVVIRIRPLTDDSNPFRAYAVLAVHPFSSAALWLAALSVWRRSTM